MTMDVERNMETNYGHDDGLYGMHDEDMDLTVILDLLWTCDNDQQLKVQCCNAV